MFLRGELAFGFHYNKNAVGLNESEFDRERNKERAKETVKDKQTERKRGRRKKNENCK